MAPASWAPWPHRGPGPAQPLVVCPGEGQWGLACWGVTPLWAPLSLRTQAPGGTLVSLSGWLVFRDLGTMAITD